MTDDEGKIDCWAVVIVLWLDGDEGAGVYCNKMLKRIKRLGLAVVTYSYRE